MSNKPLVIAHRGASGIAPENTLPAFHVAADQFQVDMIELDVQLSKDGIPVVFHDTTLERTTNGKGSLSQYKFRELQQYDAGYWCDPDGSGKFPFRGQGIQIPTLAQVLDAFPQMRFFIEMKGKQKQTAIAVYEVLKEIKRVVPVLTGAITGKLVRDMRQISSNQVETILARREVARLYFSCHWGSSDKARKKMIQKLPARFASLPRTWRGFRLDQKKFIDYLHSLGIKVFFWTVDVPDDMMTLIQNGVDGIMTNHPGRLQQLINR